MRVLTYSSLVLDGGSIKEAKGHSQWFLSFRSLTSGLKKPLLARLLLGEQLNGKPLLRNTWKSIVLDGIDLHVFYFHINFFTCANADFSQN